MFNIRLLAAQALLALPGLFLIQSCQSSEGQRSMAKARATDTIAYLNPDLPTDSRVDDLVSRMTLDEKIGRYSISAGGGQPLDTHQSTSDYKVITANILNKAS